MAPPASSHLFCCPFSGSSSYPELVGDSSTGQCSPPPPGFCPGWPLPRQSTVHSLRFPPKLTNPYFWPESALREDSPNPPQNRPGVPRGVLSDSMLLHMLFPLPGRTFPPPSEAWCLPSSCQVATSLFPFYRRGNRGSEGLSNLFKAI